MVNNIVLAIAVMALVTYLIRVTPLVLIRREIKNRTVRSFLYYVPYAVLSVMTIPAIFYSTSYIISAVIGLAVALVLSYFNRGLLTVAVFASATVLVVELILKFV